MLGLVVNWEPGMLGLVVKWEPGMLGLVVNWEPGMVLNWALRSAGAPLSNHLGLYSSPAWQSSAGV
jgi:hypothetical protein